MLNFIYFTPPPSFHTTFPVHFAFYPLLLNVPFYPTIFLKRIKSGQGGKTPPTTEIYHTPFIMLSNIYIFSHPLFHPTIFRIFTKTPMDKGVKRTFFMTFTLFHLSVNQLFIISPAPCFILPFSPFLQNTTDKGVKCRS